MSKQDFRDASLDLEARVAALLQQLTLDEKLDLCAGKSAWKTKPIPRLGIESFRVTDGPRGVAWHSSMGRHVAFPSGIALGASWSSELAYDYGVALGEQTRASGRHMVLGPAVNICRTPLNGRTFEYFTEDPWLNQALAVPVIKGIQSQRVAACIKHYAANNQESHRMKTSAELSERALREIYLPVFEAAVTQADVWSVMAAYNAVNGVPACENSDLLNDKLRSEWGFRGFVVSDWSAVRRTSSTEACVKGGLSLEMPGKGTRYKQKNLRQAYDQDKFSERELDRNLSGLLRVMVLTGHLDVAPIPLAPAAPSSKHWALARRIAAEGMVLLKNHAALLPLDTTRIRKLAVIGPKAAKRNCLPLWGGSSGVWPPYEITPLQGIKEKIADQFAGRIELVSQAEEADVVLLFVGLSHRPGLDSEVMDRKSLDLPAKQIQLIEASLAQNPNTVVVLINGGPISMEWAGPVPAILEAWYPGMEGGRAIADVLFGDINPSGKLPVSFPRRLQDSPAHQSSRTFPGDGAQVHYDEDVFIGYRHFDSREIEPLFAFGHGLSYTQFSYSDISLSSKVLRGDDVLLVKARICNVGSVAGAEVVQLYISDLECSVPRPLKELKGSSKVFLQPGQAAKVQFGIAYRDLAFYSEKNRDWLAEAGRFVVLLGSSSRDIRLEAEFDYSNK